jgi:predicted DNA-binding protein with PD1-like motif
MPPDAAVLCYNGGQSLPEVSMHRLICLVFFAVTVALPAQETRHIVTHAAAHPGDDTRPNNPQVSDVQALDAHLQRIVVLRFKYNTDLLAGLEQAIRERHIRNALILSGFGSVRSYQVHQVANRDLPPKDLFTRDPTGHADIVGMSGFVAGGRLHPHIVLANADHAFGGHLEAGTTVFTFAVVTLGVIDDDLDLSHFDDWNHR